MQQAGDPKLPGWQVFATKIAHDYVECLEFAAIARERGQEDDALAFEEAAGGFRKLMDKYQIKIRDS